MALDRLVPVSTTPGAVDGDDYMNQIAEELTGLWDRAVINLGTIGGTANAITAVATPALTGAVLVDGMPFLLKPATNNTGAVTLAIDGGAAVAIVDKDQVALAANDLVANRIVQIVYDGDISKFVIVGEVGDVPTAPTTYVDKQQFTASGTWTRDSRAVASSMTLIFGWGAGGGGGSAAAGGGGGGGGYTQRWIPTLSLGATETVTIPAGGAIDTAGGNATFGAHLTCYGGGKGVGAGGGGGGETSVGSDGGATGGGNGGSAGGPVPGSGGAGAAGANGTAGVAGVSGGGGGGNSGGGAGNGGAGAGGYFGGGGGGGGGASAGASGGQSLWGGGGGSGNGGSGGASKFAGAGGTTGIGGTAPAGGGGRNAAGGRGEIWAITYI